MKRAIEFLANNTDKEGTAQKVSPSYLAQDFPLLMGKQPPSLGRERCFQRLMGQRAGNPLRGTASL